MVKSQQFFREFFESLKINLLQSLGNLRQAGWPQAAPSQHLAQRVHVTTERHTSQQRGFKSRGPAPQERVVNDFAHAAKSLDEKPGQLWFKAGAVGNLV